MTKKERSGESDVLRSLSSVYTTATTVTKAENIEPTTSSSQSQELLFSDTNVLDVLKLPQENVEQTSGEKMEGIVKSWCNQDQYSNGYFGDVYNLHYKSIFFTVYKGYDIYSSEYYWSGTTKVHTMVWIHHYY